MAGSLLEYVGFTSTAAAREYTLRLRFSDGAIVEYTLAIPNAAFLSRRVRYQDAPDLCFHKLARELAASGDAQPEAYQQVSDVELDEYRESHAPPVPRRRPRPAQADAPRPSEGTVRAHSW